MTTTPPPETDLFDSGVPNLPIAYDSVMLGLAKECLRKFYYIIIEGWQPSGFRVHLDFGIQYHKALENYDIAKADGADQEEAVHQALRTCLSWGHYDSNNTFIPYDSGYTREPNKTRETLTRTVAWYLDYFKNDPYQTVILKSGRPAVEMSFKINLDRLAPNGNTFMLSGHLDRVVIKDDRFYFMDRKTTKSAINARYWQQFSPNNQMSLYLTATQIILGQPAAGGIVDAAEIGATYARFYRNPLTRTPGQQAEWLNDTYYWLGIIQQSAETDYWPMNDKSCSNYGGCPFQIICSRDPKVRLAFLANEGFTKQPWNPLESR